MNQKEFFFNKNQYQFNYYNEDRSGLGCLNEIVERNDYKLHLFENIENGIFIDIGANCGVNTIILAKQNPKSVVYAFEPYKKVFNLLEKNIFDNNLKNVKAFNLGVSKEGVDELTLSIYNEMSGANSSYAVNEKFSDTYHIKNETTKIKCTSLDFFVKTNGIDKIDLLKIDCEGAEFDILYNSKTLESDKIKNIVGEFHNLKYNQCDNNSSKLIEYCEKHIHGIINITVLSL